MDAILHKGDNGIFDVVVDGTLIFSKFETGDYPVNADVIASLRQHAA